MKSFDIYDTDLSSDIELFRYCEQNNAAITHVTPYYKGLYSTFSKELWQLNQQINSLFYNLFCYMRCGHNTEDFITQGCLQNDFNEDCINDVFRLRTPPDSSPVPNKYYSLLQEALDNETVLRKLEDDFSQASIFMCVKNPESCHGESLYYSYNRCINEKAEEHDYYDDAEYPLLFVPSQDVLMADLMVSKAGNLYILFPFEENNNLIFDKLDIFSLMKYLDGKELESETASKVLAGFIEDNIAEHFDKKLHKSIQLRHYVDYSHDFLMYEVCCEAIDLIDNKVQITFIEIS